MDLSDAIFTPGYLFDGTREPTCLKAADADDSGRLGISEALYITNFLFRGGVRVPNTVTRGVDPTPDERSCEAYQPGR